MIKQTATIPTNSLFQIVDKVHYKLDGHVERCKAHTWWNVNSTKIALNPYTHLITGGRNDLELSYDRYKHDISLALPETVDIIRKRGAIDIYVDKFVLSFHEEESTPSSKLSLVFNNVAPPAGSTIERAVKMARMKYLKRYGIEPTPATLRFRMLEMSIANTDHGHKDPVTTSDAKWVKWLSDKTTGLVIGVNKVEVEHTRFRGKDYVLYDGVWKEDFEEDYREVEK